MARPSVVADASALICLGWVDQLQILPVLFGRILVPPAVAAEATHRESALPALGRRARTAPTARSPCGKCPPRGGRDGGALLGLELDSAWLILDDAQARALARELELRMLGTAAVLVEAKSAGLLTRVRPALDGLLAKGFRLDRKGYDQVLKAAEET